MSAIATTSRMSARERLFAALEGRPTDHVPIWLLFPYHQLGCYVDVRELPAYQPVFEASKQYAIMLNRRTLSGPMHTEEVTRGFEKETEDGWEISRNWLEYKGKKLTSETRRKNGEVKVKKFLETDEDLEFFCDLPIETRPERLHAAMDEKLPQYLQEKKEFPEDYGAMMLCNGEPIGALYGNSNLESYAMWSLTHDDLIVDFLDRVHERLRIIYQYCLDRELADVHFLVGSELASPPLVRRSTFQRWIVPYARELIDMIRDHGKKSIQHYHGQIKEILEDFVEMGPDGLHTIEAPPVGNCTFSEAYDAVGDRITLIGNIQYDEFRALSEEEMKAAVKEVLDEVKGKRFILSPTAGPFDPEVPDQVIGNYHAFMQAGWEYDWNA